MKDLLNEAPLLTVVLKNKIAIGIHIFWLCASIDNIIFPLNRNLIAGYVAYITNLFIGCAPFTHLNQFNIFNMYFIAKVNQDRKCLMNYADIVLSILD